MSTQRPGTKLGVGTAALALATMLGFGFAAPPQQEQLPTVRVWHDPT